MSSCRRASSASSASSVSSRFRSRINGCDRAPSAHTAGSPIFSSITASSRFSRAESKILPQLANPVAHRGVSVFQMINHAASLPRFSGAPNAVIPTEARSAQWRDPRISPLPLLVILTLSEAEGEEPPHRLLLLLVLLSSGGNASGGCPIHRAPCDGWEAQPLSSRCATSPRETPRSIAGSQLPSRCEKPT
jgi:hypothetical protein